MPRDWLIGKFWRSNHYGGLDTPTGPNVIFMRSLLRHQRLPVPDWLQSAIDSGMGRRRR
jgi:hypothetical protein